MADTINATVALIGAGSMGGAIARGLAVSGVLQPDAIWASDVNEAVLAPLADMGIHTVTDCAEAVAAKTDVVIIAVKPQILAQVVSPLAPALAGRLVVSIAAGVKIETLCALLPESRVVRVMPNLPIQQLSGASAVAPSEGATAKDAELVRQIFTALGSAQIMREDQLDAEGAVVSCGPAYIALFVDALTRAGVKAGLPAGACREMVLATMEGVARGLQESGEHPRAYMEKVTSPGGTTAAGLFAMEPLVEEAAYAAVEAALRRTEELARG